MKPSQIRVGVTAKGYNERRNFLELPFNRGDPQLFPSPEGQVVFKRVFDFNQILGYVDFHLRGKIDYKRRNRFNDFGIQRVDLLHFFNGITPVRRPWVVTFETSLPRLDPSFEKGWEWLASDSCKKIIALSERAKAIQLRLLEDRPAYADVIKGKLIVASPPQFPHVEIAKCSNSSDALKFIFVGGHFYRKGGVELVAAFEKIRQWKLPASLTIVSSMEFCGYLDRHVTPEVERSVGLLIEENPLITHYKRLPNHKVIELLKESDIGILPSWGETYGYFLLEAMACGCPVIAPNASPFTEFVKPEHGWLLDIRGKSDDHGPLTITAEDSEKLVESIVSAVCEAINDRRGLSSKSGHAIEFIRRYHDPHLAARRLQQIYSEAI